jgi:hypothetical protein
MFNLQQGRDACMHEQRNQKVRELRILFSGTWTGGVVVQIYTSVNLVIRMSIFCDRRKYLIYVIDINHQKEYQNRLF